MGIGWFEQPALGKLMEKKSMCGTALWGKAPLLEESWGVWSDPFYGLWFTDLKELMQGEIWFRIGGGGGGEDGHILKVELADVEWEVKESEGLIMLLSFSSRKHCKESMGLWSEADCSRERSLLLSWWHTWIWLTSSRQKIWEPQQIGI